MVGTIRAAAAAIERIPPTMTRPTVDAISRPNNQPRPYKKLFSPPKNDKDQEPSKVGNVRDFLFSTLAFPVGIFVTISFWLLYGIDRNLVFPPKLDEFYPLWANHMLHTTCTLSQLFEMTTSFHAYPSKAKGILTSIGFALIYLGWVLVIAFQANVWVYGVLQKLPPVGRTLFMGGCSMIFGIIYLLGEHLNGRIWAVKEDEVIVEESEAYQKLSDSEKKIFSLRLNPPYPIPTNHH